MESLNSGFVSPLPLDGVIGVDLFMFKKLKKKTEEATKKTVDVGKKVGEKGVEVGKDVGKKGVDVGKKAAKEGAKAGKQGVKKAKKTLK